MTILLTAVRIQKDIFNSIPISNIKSVTPAPIAAPAPPES